MALTKSQQIEGSKIVIEHYGHPDSWEIDHWKNYDAMIRVRSKAWVSEYDLYNGSYTAYVKEFQSLQTLNLETSKLCALFEKVAHMEGLEADEKLILVNKLAKDIRNLGQENQKLTDEYVHLTQEFLILLEDGIVNPGNFKRKKPVGRPSSKIIYQWMDYLVSELGSKQKAADYASDSPLTDSKKPASLLREYRRYCNDKGEG
jgi:hypothetical protein